MTDAKPARLLVTAALPYANGPIHIGHLAGAYLPADIFARYQRLMGQDVVFICGSDEHGVPIMLRARSEGVSPQVVVDRYHAQMEAAFRGFGMSFDYYGRTSSPKHRETSQDFFRKLDADGAFVLRTESQLYDPEAQLFLADRFVRGTCPRCGHEDAYGDQCEKCGSTLSPKELKNPRSAITNAVPVERDTTHWYLPLARYQPWLEQWIGAKTWKPNVVGQIKSWLADGLGERPMSRDQPWGVPFPPDVAERAGVDARDKVLYVWFDAPIGYITATQEWASALGTPERWKDYWCDPTARLVHFIGKDNIVFHCIIFPAMLHQHGGYVLPEAVPANEFLNLRGLKFSTSRGVAVWLHEFLEAFPADYLRYALARTLPETKDADFSWEELQALVNNELADTLGNLFNRSLQFAVRFLDGEVPTLQDPNEQDRAMLNALSVVPEKVGTLIETYQLREAINTAMGLARQANKYFNDAQPWSSRTSDPRACANTIHVSLQVAASLSILFEPFLPESAAKMRRMLGLAAVRSSAPLGAPAGRGWADAAGPLLTAGTRLGQPEILFTKLEDEVIAAQTAELVRRATAPAAKTSQELPCVPVSANVAFDDFTKLDLRAGRVLEAERVKKSDKLIRCVVDIGLEKRQILAGVAEHMTPEELLGMKVVVVANLAARKMLGLESCGMLLMAKDRDGKLTPVRTEGEPGATIS